LEGRGWQKGERTECYPLMGFLSPVRLARGETASVGDRRLRSLEGRTRVGDRHIQEGERGQHVKTVEQKKRSHERGG